YVASGYIWSSRLRISWTRACRSAAVFGRRLIKSYVSIRSPRGGRVVPGAPRCVERRQPRLRSQFHLNFPVHSGVFGVGGDVPQTVLIADRRADLGNGFRQFARFIHLVEVPACLFGKPAQQTDVALDHVARSESDGIDANISFTDERE